MDKLITTARERLWHPEAYARDRWLQEQARKLPPGSRVLDAGAGASKYRPFFAHCRYETQDFCQYKGELVQYLQPIDHVCNITAIPLPDRSLDAIVCTEVIEHVVDPVAAVSEFARLLKEGGKLFLTAPLLSHLHMEPYHYFGGFTPYWYRHWLPAKGFEVESITPIGGPAQSCVTFCQVFYTAWAKAERNARLWQRWFSRGARALAKPLVHYALPWLLPKFDPLLGSELVAAGYMVVASRQPGSRVGPETH